MLVLVLSLQLFLTGCAKDVFKLAADPVLPQYPIAGPAVAEELAKVCIPESLCPATWEWLGRIDKLADKLPQVQ